MKSPIFEAMGAGQQGGGFVQFMQQMRGKNPNDIINQMMRSGKLSQDQLNAVQQRAQQMRGMFDGFKSMFGF